MAKEVQRDSEGRPLYGGTVKVAALCVIVMQYVQSFVTPALSAVRGAYQEVGIDTVMIQQIQGIPSLMAIFGAILVGILERYMKKKTILIIAMVLMFLGSFAAFVPETAEGFYILLATRVALGLGRGMIFPMASSFIADLFFGKTRDRLMSFKTAVGGLSGSVFQIIGGMLAVLSWRYAFIGMLMAAGAAWLPRAFIFVLAGIWNIFQFSYMTSMSLTLAGTGLGKTDMAGWIMSLETVMSAVGAICYGAFLKGRLGGFDLPIAIALETIGFAVMCNVVTVPGFVIGTVLYGFAFGVFNPALILQLVKVLPREGATLGLSILAGAQNLCQFFSAPVLAFLAPILGVAGVAGEASASLANWNVSWRLGIVYFIIVLAFILVAKAKRPDMLAGLKEPKAAPEDEK